MNLRDMTPEQQLEWGLEERNRRLADMDGPQTLETLRAAQEAAATRRRLIGASVNEATRMVVEANRHLRRQEAAR